MAIAITRDMVSSKSSDFVRLRVNGSQDGVSLPEKVITISTAAIAEGAADVAGIIIAETARAETRLSNLIAAQQVLEGL